MTLGWGLGADVEATDHLETVVRAVEQTFRDLRAQLEQERAIRVELLAALKLYVDHFGDPLKVARAAIHKASEAKP